MGRGRLHEPHPGAGGHGPVDDPHRAHHAPVLVVGGIEDEGLEGGVGVACRGGDALAHRVEQGRDPLPGLGRQPQDRVSGNAQHLLDLGRVPVGVGGGQVDLVEGGHDLEVMLQGQVAVGQRLRLDALEGVDH